MALHFILDGYNIIKRMPAMADLKLEAGRNYLLKLLEEARPQGSVNNKVTVVFDGQAEGLGGYGAAGETAVIFTSYDSADDRIKVMVDEAANPSTIVVVTDDKDIRHYVRSLGAKVLGVEEFLRQGTAAAAFVKPPARVDKKNISKTMEHQINQEFLDVWVSKKKRTKT